MWLIRSGALLLALHSIVAPGFAAPASEPVSSPAMSLREDVVRPNPVHLPPGTAPRAKVIDDGNEWLQRDAGIFGGDVNDLLVDPNDDDVIYAAERAVGILRSTDGGESWQRVSDVFSSKLSATTAVPARIFASSPCGLQVSDDGLTWDFRFPVDFCIEDVDVDPNDNDRILISGDDTGLGDDPNERVALSEDGGFAFEPMNLDLLAPGNLLQAIARFLPGVTGGIVAVTRDFFDPAFNTIRLSTNDGDSFVDLTANLTALVGGTGQVLAAVQGFGVHPDDPDLWFLVGSVGNDSGADLTGIFRSADRGVSWSQVSNAAPFSFEVLEFDFDPTDEDRVFVGGLVSLDGGQNWSELDILGGERVPSIDAAAVVPGNPMRLLVGGDGLGVRISTDDGASFREPADGFEGAKRISAVAVDVGDTLLVASQNWGIFRSTDRGQSWERTLAGPFEFTDIRIAPSDRQVAYASTMSETAPLLRSNDNGRSWQVLDLEPGFEGTAQTLWIDSADANRVFVGSRDIPAVLRSDDGGASWTTIRLDDNTGCCFGSVNALAQAPDDRDVLFAATDSRFSGLFRPGIYRSVDGGASWTPSSAGLGANPRLNAVVIDPRVPNTLYTGGFCDGVFRSDDGGANWTALPDSGNCIRSLSISPVNNRRIVTDEPLLSNDGGASWDGFSPRLFGTGQVLFNSTGDRLIAGTNAALFVREIDSLSQGVVADDGEAGDEFGRAVAASGNRVAIGVPGDDDSGENAGAVFIYRREGSELVLETKIPVPAGFTAAEFGAAIDLEGDLLLVGAPGMPPALPKGTTQLQAAIFERLGQNWDYKEAVMPVGSSTADDRFGASVSLNGGRIAIGAPMDTDSGEGAGAAYLFDFDGQSLNFLDRKLPPPGSAGAGFGQAVAAGPSGVAVGAPGLPGVLAGAVTLYSQVGQNLGSVTGDSGVDDGFGTSIALDGNQMVIGAPGEDAERGAAYLFAFQGTSFSRQDRFSASDGAAGDRFGAAVATNGDRIAVGAPAADGLLEGSGAGSVYLYGIAAGSGVGDERELASTTGEGTSGFGQAVALTDTDLIIGAPQTGSEQGAAQLVSDTDLLFRGSFEAR